MKLIMILILIIMILIVGCTTIIHHKDIPFCKDIDVIGVDCHSPLDASQCLFLGKDCKPLTYNYSEAICKEYYVYTIEEDALRFCFDTWENRMGELKDKFKKCWNCPEETIEVEPNQTMIFITDRESYYNKTECTMAGDCSSNMNLTGCSYDGCNYCCNNECTLMRCEKDPFNIEDLRINESKINEGLNNSRPFFGELIISNRRSEPTNEKIPDNYKLTTVYETVCECLDIMGISGHPCRNEYCYNKSRGVWLPR